MERDITGVVLVMLFASTVAMEGGLASLFSLGQLLGSLLMSHASLSTLVVIESSFE
jgi:hypothetical protein